MKLIYFIFFVSFLFSCSHSETKKTPQEVQPFNLALETYIKAELLGGSNHYIINDSSIRIFKTYNIVGIDTNVIYSKKIKNSSIQLYFSNLKLNTLDDMYINEKIMISSGQHFYIDYQNKNYTKHIWLSNYYLTEIKNVVDSLNTIVPKEYRINYSESFLNIN